MTSNRSAKLQILFIALVFFGPLLLAVWMYASGQLTPSATTNHGELLDPVVNVAEALPDSALLAEDSAEWQLIYLGDGPCEESCRDALYRQRQIRLMLGSEMDRVRRVFLHGESVPDRVFLEDQHEGLITIRDEDLRRFLDAGRPAGLSSGGLYLLDPLENLVMYFAPEIEPSDMVDDLKHLLELSRIG